MPVLLGGAIASLPDARRLAPPTGCAACTLGTQSRPGEPGWLQATAHPNPTLAGGDKFDLGRW
jgi:hypothetical protein